MGSDLCSSNSPAIRLLRISTTNPLQLPTSLRNVHCDTQYFAFSTLEIHPRSSYMETRSCWDLVIRRLWNGSLHIMLMRSQSRLQTGPILNEAVTQHTRLASRTAFGNTIRVYPDSCQDSHSRVATSSHPLHLSAASCLLLEYHRVSARAIDQIPSKSGVSEEVPCQARNLENKVPLYPCL